MDLSEPQRRPERLDWITVAEHVGTLYVVVGAGRPQRGGHGYGQAYRASISQAAEGGARVETEVYSSAGWPGEFADNMMLHRLLPRIIPESPTFPLSLRIDRWEDSVQVSGHEVPFTFIGTSHSWVGSGLVDGPRRVQLMAQGLDASGLALEPIGPPDVL